MTWKTFLTIAAGSIAGLVGGAFSPLLLKEPSPQAKRNEPPTASAPVQIHGPSEDVAPLSSTVPSTESVAVPTRAAQAQPMQAAQAQPMIEDPAVLLRTQQEAFQARIDEHSREPIDRDWSSNASRSLNREFDVKSKERNYALLNVDCRTTSCVANLRWQSYEDARLAVEGIMTDLHEVNCTRELFLPPPEDPNAPYQAQVFMDCTDER